MKQSDNNYNNKAFISYSSKDEEIAKRLQKELEEIVIPPGICKLTKIEKDHLGKIYRDRTDLPAGCPLTEEIKSELDNTEWLITVCSNNVHNSTWVNDEINHFSRLSEKINKIIPFIAYSTTHETNIIDCFPRELINVQEKNGDILAADSRHGKDGWERAFAKTIACLLNIKLDDWIQRLQYDIEIQKYCCLINEVQKEIEKNNFDEAQNKFFSYIKEEKTFNLVNIELQFLLKKCNMDIGIYYIDSNIFSIDYNNNIIVIGTVTGDVIILDMLCGDIKLSFKAHSETINSVNILENNLILTHTSSLDKTTIKLWCIEQAEQLIWEISHPAFFPENIVNDTKFKLFKDFLVLNKTSNIAFTPGGKLVAFSTGGYVAVADINTSKIIYYVEMPQPIPIMVHINFINEIAFNSKLNYGIATSLHKTIYWNVDTGNIIENLTEEEKEAIDTCDNEKIKSNLFNLTIDYNKITIFERNQIPTFFKNIQYYIHNTQGNNNFVVIEDQFVLCSDYTKIIHKIEKNNCPFLINFYATISECGNYLVTTKPSDMSKPGNIIIYSTNNGKSLISYHIKNVSSHHLMRLVTIYCIGAYITNDFEVISYISDNSIRTHKKNKDTDIYQTNINKKPSKVSFYNKNLLYVIYTDGSVCIWKYSNNKWINIDIDIKNISCATFISEYIVALGDINGYLFLWKLDDNLLIKSNNLHIDKINCLLLIPDSERLILGCDKFIKILIFNIYLEKFIKIIDIEISINPDNIYIDKHKNKIIVVEKNTGLEVIHMEKIYDNKEDIAIEKFNYRKMLLSN